MSTVTSKSRESSSISIWLNQNLLALSEGNEITTLLSELNFLLKILPVQYQLDLKSEYDELLQWITHQQTIESNKLNDRNDYEMTVQELKKPKDIKERYLIAFLANRSLSDKINQIRSLYFFICLHLVKLTDYDSRIKTTLNECRFLTSNRRSFLVQFLPDLIYCENLEALLLMLNETRVNDSYSRWKQSDEVSLNTFAKKIVVKVVNSEYESVETIDRQNIVNEKISSFLYEYILPLENYFKSESGITRSVKQNQRNIDGPKYFDDITGNIVSDLFFITEVDDDTGHFEAGERQDNDDVSIEQVFIVNPTNYYMDIVKAEQQVNCRHQRMMSQVTDVNVAHPTEIKALINFLITKLSELNLKKLEKLYDNDEFNLKHDLDHLVALYLSLLLLSGRPELFTSENFKLSYRSYQHPIFFAPTQSVLRKDWDEGLCAKNQDALVLFFPELIGKIHSCLTLDLDKNLIEQIEKRAKEQLKTINKNKKTRLTTNKVQTYLSHFLFQRGKDLALINVLINKSINHMSAMPYFNVSQYDVFTCQQEYNEHLLQIINESSSINYHEKFFVLPEENAADYWDKQTGSLLVPEESNLRDRVINLLSDLKECIQSRDFNDLESIVSIHNMFTDYLYIMLAISSGYRPVNEPFGRISHIDTRTKMYFISDKNNRMGSKGRFVYLPELANEQIKRYINYLKFNANILLRLDNSLGEIYLNIYKSNYGLICYLNFDKSTNTITEVKLTTTYVNDRLFKIIGLPINWYRHYIRSDKCAWSGLYSNGSKYSDECFGYDVIGAWMGHADEMGFDFYDKYSGLKRIEMHRFSKQLNQILGRIGFEIVDLEYER